MTIPKANARSPAVIHSVRAPPLRSATRSRALDVAGADLIRLDGAGVEQPADERAGHVPAADEADLPARHEGRNVFIMFAMKCSAVRG